MRHRVRQNAVCAAMAAAACSAMAWLGLYGFAWGDYEIEAEPAFRALSHGHLLDFLRLAPAYGGSLVERAPFALIPGLWGGGQLAVYRMVALPCLLASAALGVWLIARMRAQGSARLARAVALGVCVANPITLVALEAGHPEELLGGCLCVAAVALAARSVRGRDRSLLAGILLGLAIANKEWALVAAGPVILVAPPGRRLRCLAAAAATAAAVLAPLVLVRSGGFVSSAGAVAAPAASTIFKPWQVWWFFGHHSALALGPGDRHNHLYRLAPAWIGAISHPLIVAVGFAFAGALWLRSRAHALTQSDALLALALILLVRCALDTWDETYYLLPFVLALLAWELAVNTRRPPVLAPLATVLVWVSFEWLPEHSVPDAQAAAFLAWSLPLAAWLGWQLLPRAYTRATRPGRARLAEPAQETTVSSFGRLVNTS
jgi:hypothetical protein